MIEGQAKAFENKINTLNITTEKIEIPQNMQKNLSSEKREIIMSREFALRKQRRIKRLKSSQII